jgi:hypothetical protein
MSMPDCFYKIYIDAAPAQRGPVSVSLMGKRAVWRSDERFAPICIKQLAIIDHTEATKCRLIACNVKSSGSEE